MSVCSKTWVNWKRMIPETKKSAIYEFTNNCANFTNDLNEIVDLDVVFNVNGRLFKSHTSVIGRYSHELYQCFELLKTVHESCTINFDHTRVHISHSGTSRLFTVIVDAAIETFESIFEYFNTQRLFVSLEALPSVFVLCKQLHVVDLLDPCANHLAENVTVNNIGDICRLVLFERLADASSYSTDEDSILCGVSRAEYRLTSSAYDYLVHMADAIACLRTGQLTARLMVKLIDDGTADSISSCSAEHVDARSVASSSTTSLSSVNGSSVHQTMDDQTAFSILHWFHVKLASMDQCNLGNSVENLGYASTEEAATDDDYAGVDGGERGRKFSGNLRSENSATNLSECGSKMRRSSHSHRLQDHLQVLTHRLTTQLNRLNLDQDDEDELPLDGESRGLDNNSARWHLTTATTQDVRVTLDMHQLSESSIGIKTLSRAPSPTSAPETSFQHQQDEPPGNILSSSIGCLLVLNSPDNRAENETCLLTATSLGVGKTSIWLGKLNGHLVSLSIQRSRTQSIPGNTPPLSRHHSGQSITAFSTAHSHNESHVVGGLAPLVCSSETRYPCRIEDRQFAQLDLNFESGEDEQDEERTMTASAGFSLAKAATELLSKNPINILQEPSVGDSSQRTEFGTLTTTAKESFHLLEARSGAGTGSLLTACGECFIITVGGYRKEGCLDSVELLRRSELNSILSSDGCSPDGVHFSVGPKLSKPRGRLGLATVMSDFPSIYACGGSTGSLDLNSVERLTPNALESWLAAQSVLPIESTVRPSRSSAAVNPCGMWQSVSGMTQARSSPSAVGLTGLHATGPLCSQANQSVIVAGGLSGAVPLSTVEAFIPERNEWVQLPNMSEGRYEASLNILPSKNLVVVAGGTTIVYSLSHSSTTFEALDLRNPSWIRLPMPNAFNGDRLRGCCLLPCPTDFEALIMTGGFNGRETLTSSWIFDPVAWRWLMGPPLHTARAGCCGLTLWDPSTTVILGGFNVFASPTGFLNSVEFISSHRCI